MARRTEQLVLLHVSPLALSLFRTLTYHIGLLLSDMLLNLCFSTPCCFDRCFYFLDAVVAQMLNRKDARYPESHTITGRLLYLVFLVRKAGLLARLPPAVDIDDLTGRNPLPSTVDRPLQGKSFEVGYFMKQVSATLKSSNVTKSSPNPQATIFHIQTPLSSKRAQAPNIQQRGGQMLLRQHVRSWKMIVFGKGDIVQNIARGRGSKFHDIVDFAQIAPGAAFS